MTVSLAEGRHPRSQGRLEMLDGLRGVAVLAVFLMHAGIRVSPGFHSVMVSYVDLGAFGVMLFFLCSGFVIPMSLERHHSISRFWVQRFFRLYPLYWCSVLGALACYYAGLVTPSNDLAPGPVSAILAARPIGTVLANLLMLQPFLGFPYLIEPYWTLAIELVFYGTMSALFVAGSLNRIVPVTIRFLILVILITVLVQTLHLKIPTGNLCAFCTMFVGAVYHRVYTGELSLRIGIGVTALTMIMIVSTMLSDIAVLARPEYSFNVLSARVGAFPLFALLLLKKLFRVPSALQHLGRMSYSIYLIHPLVLVLIPPLSSPVLSVLLWFSTVLAISSVTYRWIELPCIARGRRLTDSQRFSRRGRTTGSNHDAPESVASLPMLSEDQIDPVHLSSPSRQRSVIPYGS